MAPDELLFADIALELRQSHLRPVYTARSERLLAPNGKRQIDFAVVDARNNLGQAVTLRLLTPRGELSALGHPDFGSRLHELVGELNSDTVRDLVRLYILEALAQEPRIEKVISLDVAPDDQHPSLVNVSLLVQPITGGEPLAIGPFGLELEA